MIKHNKNIDRLEFVFGYKPIDIVERLLVKRVELMKIDWKLATDMNTGKIYIKDGEGIDIVDLTIRETIGFIEGRIYCKIRNHVFYNPDFKSIFVKISRLMIDFKYLHIQNIDFSFDLINISIFDNIDFNIVEQGNNMRENKLLCSKDGKSLYFNMISKTKKRKRVDKTDELLYDGDGKPELDKRGKKAITAILYTKSELIKNKEHHKKYINPEGDLLERLEIRLIRTKSPERSKYGRLIEIISHYLWYETDYFFDKKDYIAEYIAFNTENLWSIKDTEGREYLLNYKKIFGDTIDQQYIKDFIEYIDNKNKKLNKVRAEEQKVRRQKEATAIKKRDWIKKVNSIIVFMGQNFKNCLTDDNIKILLDELNITSINDFEYIKKTESIRINGRDLFNEIYSYIRSRAVDILSELEVSEIDLFDEVDNKNENKKVEYIDRFFEGEWKIGLE